jgi:hypothetical protein
MSNVNLNLVLIDYSKVSCIQNLTLKIVKLLRLWWMDVFDPAHCRVAHGVRVTEMYWVEGVRPP